MNKKDSVLKQWWFTLIIIPAISILTTLVYWLTDGNQTTSLMLSWLIIFSIGTLIQWIMLIRHKIKYRSGYFMFLALVVLASLFVGFFFSEFMSKDEEKWYIYMVAKPLVPFVVLFIIKTIIWYTLSYKVNNKKDKDVRLRELEQEVIDLQSENEDLVKTLNVLKEDNQELKNREQELQQAQEQKQQEKQVEVSQEESKNEEIEEIQDKNIDE